MSRKLNDLDHKFRPFVAEFIAILVENQIHILIVETRRTEEQQKLNIANKVSWIKHSKHQDGLAIDIVPYEIYNLHGDDKLNYDANDPIWDKIGIIGESIGLIWGGRWLKKDMGHFEYNPAKPVLITI